MERQITFGEVSWAREWGVTTPNSASPRLGRRSVTRFSLAPVVPARGAKPTTSVVILLQTSKGFLLTQKNRLYPKIPTLKRELIHRTSYATRSQARTAVFEYIEVFYNRQRLHSALGYLSPVDFEAQGQDP